MKTAEAQSKDEVIRPEMLLWIERRREVNTGSFLDGGIDGPGSRYDTGKFAGWRTYISALFCVSKSAAAGREKLEAGPQKSRRKKELNISKMCSWILFSFFAALRRA